MSIGVTQRVEICENYGGRDCLDQEWTNLINVAGFDLVIIPNAIRNIENWLENKNVSGIILTGGNDLSHLINAKIQPQIVMKLKEKFLNGSQKIRFQY